MAFKKTLVQRLFNLSRFSTPSMCRNAAGRPPLMDSNPARTAMDPDPGESGRVKRMNQRRPLYQSAVTSPELLRLFPLQGETLVEKLRGMDITRERLNLDGLVAFPKNNTSTFPHAVHGERERGEHVENSGLTVSEVKKVLRATQVEMIRGKLRDVGRDWVMYNEFVDIIETCCGGNRDQAMEFAKTLDESGSVIVLGNAVCLRPHQVAKAIQSLVTPPVLSANPNDPRRKELEVMEEQKVEIDQKAEALVRRELWAGLGYMVVQTAAFMRLTFWELSWDVMEPICFYVTSAYFMLGYTFFLKTAKEPSFEGFFQSRFTAKQKRLMKTHDFNLERYNELKKAFYPHSSSSTLDYTKMIKFDHQ